MAASIPLSEAPPMNSQYLPAKARDDIPAWQQTVAILGMGVPSPINYQ
jgi:hypothetical protein